MERGHRWSQEGRIHAFPEVVNRSSARPYNATFWQMSCLHTIIPYHETTNPDYCHSQRGPGRDDQHWHPAKLWPFSGAHFGITGLRTRSIQSGYMMIGLGVLASLVHTPISVAPVVQPQLVATQANL